MNSNARELYHYGIPGQKWGIRNYQNEDGTLTEAGKARYNSDGTRKDPRKMSNNELKEANKRLQAEENYRRSTSSSMGKKVVVSVLASTAGTVLVNGLGSGPTLMGKALVNKILLNAGLATIATVAGSYGSQIRN